jgi:hypothetical protein
MRSPFSGCARRFRDALRIPNPRLASLRCTRQSGDSQSHPGKIDRAFRIRAYRSWDAERIPNPRPPFSRCGAHPESAPAVLAMRSASRIRACRSQECAAHPENAPVVAAIPGEFDRDYWK